MIFDRSSYDVIKIQMPVNGMNQDISPESLDLSYAYILENIIPRPLGEGRVRYGTSSQLSLGAASNIIGSFPYTSINGDEQLLLYSNNLTRDETAVTFSINNDLLHISFTTQNVAAYKADLRIKLIYQVNNITATIVDNIKDIIIDDHKVIISLYKTIFTEAGDQAVASIYYDIGKIYLSTNDGFFTPSVGIDAITREGDIDLKFVINPNFNQDYYTVGKKIELTSNNIAKIYTINDTDIVGNEYFIKTFELLPAVLVNPSVKYVEYFKLLTENENLQTVCIPRYVCFADKLFICNGLDKLKIWDGTNLTDYFQYLIDEVQNIARIDDHNLSFTLGALSSINNYPIGGKVKLVNNGITQIVTITNSQQALQVVTITLAEVLNAFHGARIFYQAFPPRFSYMFSMHNRLWCLGAGAAGIKYRNSDQAQRVYFMYKKGATLEFFDERTKIVPSINLAESNSIGDNLEAIAYTSGYMFFIGRNVTQVWSGSEPLGALVDPDKPILTHTTTLNVGAIHGDLVLSVGNDVFIITKNGLISCGTFREGSEQISANSLTSVDPLIINYVSTITQNNLAYLNSRSFRYDGESFVGFKIGFNNVLCSIVTTTLGTWCVLSGNFKQANTFCYFKNSLYMTIGEKLYKYADGKDGSNCIYGDDNGASPVFFMWSLPVLKFDKVHYSNLFYDLNISYPSSFTIREENSISLSITGDVPVNYSTDKKYSFELNGDLFATVPLSLVSRENLFGFRFDQQHHQIQKKLKFVASRFWITLSGNTKDGIISIKDMKFYGVIERKENNRRNG